MATSEMPASTCLHGDGARVVLDDPAPVDREKQHPARLFPPDPFSQTHERVVLTVNERDLAIDMVDRSAVLHTADASGGGTVTLSGYSRIAPEESDDREEAHAMLAAAFMTGLDNAPPPDPLPAVYTYFGQFLAHELSRLWKVRQNKFANLNSAALDLDTFFGPVGFKHDKDLAQGSVSLGGVALGDTAPPGQALQKDLPRRDDGAPLTPDCRSDANLMLAQVHVALAETYHALVRRSDAATARRELTRLIHDVTIHDYLHEIIDPLVFEDVLCHGRLLVEPGGHAPTAFLLPVEFAAAAFRFGHAMVRGSYNWTGPRLGHPASLQALMRLTHLGGGLFPDVDSGVRRLPSDWVADRQDLAGRDVVPVNPACAIGPSLSAGLQQLYGQFVPESTSATVNLAERTLARGRQVGLPSAQALWSVLQAVSAGRYIGQPLAAGQIAGSSASPLEAALTHVAGGAQPMTIRTPLWFYVLREAEVIHAGRRLGPLGGRIVMETLHAAVLAAGGTIGRPGRASLRGLIG